MKVLYTFILVLLLIPITINAAPPIRYKAIIEKIKQFLKHPAVEAGREFVDQTTETAEFLLDVRYKIAMNEPIVRSESALTTFVKEHFEELGPYVSLEARLEVVKKRFRDIDLSTVREISFESLTVNNFRGLEDHILNQEIMSRVAELENLRIIVEQLNELQQEAEAAKKDLEMARRLMHAAAKAIVEVIERRPDLNFLLKLFGTYLFDAWYDFDISYPKLVASCKDEILNKQHEIKQLLVTKLKPGYQKYGTQLYELVKLQRENIKKRKDEYDRKKEELEKRNLELKTWQQQITQDSILIETNKRIIDQANSEIPKLVNNITAQNGRIATNNKQLAVFNDPEYKQKNYKACPSQPPSDYCNCIHIQEKANFDKAIQNEINSIVTDNQRAQSIIQQSNQQIAYQNQQRALAQQQNAILIPALADNKARYSVELAKYEEMALAFFRSLMNEFILHFVETNQLAETQVSAFLQFTNSL